MALLKQLQHQSQKIVLLYLIFFYLPLTLLAGYAPDKAPDLPDNVSEYFFDRYERIAFIY